MRAKNLRGLAVGLVVVAIVFAVLFWLSGVEDVLAALRRADPLLVGVVAGLILLWIVVWGMALRTVLGVLDAPISRVDATLVYAAAAFANSVTPFGQAGGEPIAALIISRIGDIEYEQGLASIASVDALNFVPSISLALVGIVYYTTSATLDSRLTTAGAVVVGMAIGIPIAVVTGWRYRYQIEGKVVAIVTPIVTRITKFVPRLSVMPGAEIEERIERFFASIERVATSRLAIGRALSYSTMGVVAQALAMWVTFYALGTPVSIAVPMFVVPIGAIASVAPTPGGMGGIESVHVALLASTTSVGLATITAVVLIYRVGGYWLVVAVGGGAAAVLRAR